MENQIRDLIQRILERIEVLNEEEGKQESITECLLFVVELQKILLTEKELMLFLKTAELVDYKKQFMTHSQTPDQ